MVVGLLRRMNDQVGTDGVSRTWNLGDTPACVQAFFARVMASEGNGGIAAHQRRDHRECETFSIFLDEFALGELLGLRLDAGCYSIGRFIF